MGFTGFGDGAKVGTPLRSTESRQRGESLLIRLSCMRDPQPHGQSMAAAQG